MTAAMAEFQQYTESVRDEGRLSAVRTLLLNLYRRRFGAVPDSVEQSILAITDEDRLQDLALLFATASPADITAALSL